MGDSAGHRADGHQGGAGASSAGSLGGAVGDDASDRCVGFGVGVAASGEALEWAPLLQLGVGALDTDPGRGLPPIRLAPGPLLAVAAVVGGLLRRAASAGRRPDRGTRSPGPGSRRRPRLLPRDADGIARRFLRCARLRPGRCAWGRRTWTSVPSIRRSMSSASASANRSSSVRRRSPGRSGTANPRSASNARISRTAVETVERSTEYSSASAAWGSSWRRQIRVSSSRSVNTSLGLRPAPAALRRSPPRRSVRSDSRDASQRGASSAKCWRVTPVKAGCDRAARFRAGVTSPDRAARH